MPSVTGLHVPWFALGFLLRRQGIDEARQFLVGFRRLGHEGDEDVRTKQVVHATMAIQKFCPIVAVEEELRAIQPPLIQARRRSVGQREPVEKRRARPCRSAGPKRRRGPVVRFQNMPEQERREQRRVHEPEHQLEHVHDVIELPGDERGRGDADEDADHRGPCVPSRGNACPTCPGAM